MARSNGTDVAGIAGAAGAEQERQLVEAVISGCDGAFDRLHALYRDRVYAFALKRLRDAAEAEDVCQDVFVQVFRCLGSFEGRSSLLTWLFGITHHQICRRLRRRRLPTLSIDESEAVQVRAESADAESQLDAARALARCQRALDHKVSETQRQVFQLHYGRNCSTRDIARRLGKSKQAVKISLFRARRVLSAEMQGRGLLQSA